MCILLLLCAHSHGSHYEIFGGGGGGGGGGGVCVCVCVCVCVLGGGGEERTSNIAPHQRGRVIENLVLIACTILP
jgi:hypothetical protein